MALVVINTDSSPHTLAAATPGPAPVLPTAATPLAITDVTTALASNSGPDWAALEAQREALGSKLHYAWVGPVAYSTGTLTLDDGLFMPLASTTIPGLQSAVDKIKSNTIVSVKEFGATGDGSTDDYAAFVAAQASLTSGGTLFIPPGTYALSAPFHVSKSIALKGASPGLNSATILHFTTPGPGLLVDSFQTSLDGGDASFCSIQDMHLRGTQPAEWAINTTYIVGDYVVNTEHRAAFTQHIYKCVVAAGAGSGTVEPLWPMRGDANTFLTANMLIGDVSLACVSAVRFPASGTIKVGLEQITYSGKTGTTLTGLTRGVNGTSAAAHTAPLLVREVYQDSPHGRLGYLSENTFFTDQVGNVWQVMSAPGVWVRRQAYLSGLFIESFAGDAFYMYGYVQPVHTLLNGGINNSVTTIPVVSTADLPTSGILLVESEQIKYTGVTATSFTGCTRGFAGTTAVSHTDQTAISPTRFSAATSSVVENSYAESNYGRCVYTEGTDASVMMIANVIGQVNDSGGIFDNADLGSKFDACLMEQNGIYFWAPLTAASTWATIPAHPRANGVGGPGITNNGYFYRPVGGGTTAASEPTWPTTIGDTVLDGSVTWTCVGIYRTGQPYMNRDTGLTPTKFDSCYSEPDQVCSEIFFPAIVIGGQGAGFSDASWASACIISNGSDVTSLVYKSKNQSTNVSAALGRLPVSSGKEVFGWGRRDAGDVLQNYYEQRLSADGKYWELIQNGSAIPMKWTASSSAGEGDGQVTFPQGLYFGRTTAPSTRAMLFDSVQVDAGATPSTNGLRGDIAWNKYSDYAAQPFWSSGYVCIDGTGAGDAVWRPFEFGAAKGAMPLAGSVGAPYDLLASFHGSTIADDNHVAGLKEYYNLPVTTSRQGFRFKFVVEHASGMRITADGANIIRLAGGLTSAGGYIESTTIGDYIVLEAIGDSPIWVATTVVGNWTTDTGSSYRVNSTPATVGVVKTSALFTMGGSAWNSLAAVSQLATSSIEALPIENAGAIPNNLLIFYKNYNNLGNVEHFRISDYGGYGALGSAATTPNGFAFTTNLNGVLGGGYGFAFNANSNSLDFYCGTQNGGVPDFSLAYGSVRIFTPNTNDNARFGNSGTAWKESWVNLYAMGDMGGALTISSNTIAPTRSFHPCGAGTLKTITPPAGFIGPIHLHPTAGFTYDATGNILVPAGGGTATQDRLITFAYNGTKWVPSY